MSETPQQNHLAASETTNSPQLILLYTLCAAFVFLPRLNTYLNTPVTASLVSHLIIAVVFFGTLIFLAIESFYIASKLLFILLEWLLLQSSSDTCVSDYVGAQWRLSRSEDSRFWIKLAISAIAGIWLTWKLFFNSTRAEAKGWEAAKHNIAAKREAQKVTAAEQGGVVKDTDNGPAWLWATFALAYAMAIFDSREWFESILRGGVKVERTIEWEWVCLWAPMLIAGLVGLARWGWTVATKARGTDVRDSSKKDLGAMNQVPIL
ncbi:hypothetical protein KCU91_g11762, partial [Aureobasidium melanogenum]